MIAKRNTIQKQVVFDILTKMHNHPSAGMVYEAVHEKYPEISKATVYRLLADAAEEGDLLRLKLAGADDRYDVTLKTHYHVVCRKCGHVADVVTDIDMPKLMGKTEGCENFLVEDCHMEFVGVCDKCRNSDN